MGDVRQEDGIDLITLDKGSKDGLDIGWQGKFLKGRSGQTPLTTADYDLIVDSVTPTSAVAELVGLTLDQVGTNRRLLLHAPPLGQVVTPPVRVRAHISELRLSSSDVILILVGATGKALTKNDVDFTVISVTDDEATAQGNRLTLDLVGDNRRVVLRPPLPAPGAPAAPTVPAPR